MLEPDKPNTKIDDLTKLEADITVKLSSLVAKDRNDDPWPAKYLREEIQTDLCEYNWLIVKKLVSLMQADSITQEQILELHTKAKRFDQDLEVIFPKGSYYSSFSFRWSNWGKNQENTVSPNLHISKAAYGRRRNYEPYIIKNNLITSLLFFNTRFGRHSKYINNFNLEYNFVSELFSDKNTLIYFAVIFDNPSALKIFLDQIIAINPQRTYKNIIDDLRLVGIAAANGCIKVLRFFIDMKANFERRYIIDTNAEYYQFAYNECDLRSLLIKYRNCTLEMSALALAICALPAMHETNATELLDLLLSTGADPHQDVIVRWQAAGVEDVEDNEDVSDEEEVSDEKKLRMEPVLKRVKLADFDHTGIFSGLMRMRQAQSGKKTLPVISEIDAAEIAVLRASVTTLEKKYTTLLDEIKAMLAAQADAFKAELEKRDKKIDIPKKK